MNLLALSEQVINGLVIGIFYATAALGLSLIFGVLKIVNFAHGELYMIGGFVYYVVAAVLGFLTAGLVLRGMIERCPVPAVSVPSNAGELERS